MANDLESKRGISTIRTCELRGFARKSRRMNKMLLLLAPVILLTGCDTTTMQQMPRDPYVGRKIEKMEGGQSTDVNHPNLDPSRDGRYDRYDRGYRNYRYDGYNNPYYRGRRYY